jgi:hypothetical protein
MLKWIFFRVVTLIQSLKPSNWSVIRVRTFTSDLLTEANVSGSKMYEYVYNGRVYKYIGDELPTRVSRGFILPIKQALWNGVDVTLRIREYAGPRQDFFGSFPDASKIFYRIIQTNWKPQVSVRTTNGLGLSIDWAREDVIVPENGTLEVTNIMGQSILGAK